MKEAPPNRPTVAERVSIIEQLMLSHDWIKGQTDRELALEVTDVAKDAIAARGYDPEFGARPLKRLIARAIVDPLAQAILEGRFGPGSKVIADLQSDDPDAEIPELVLRQG